MKIELAFDYASPWSFLASATLRERFAGLEVTYVPTYLRGFDTFRDGVPYGSSKLAYLLRDFDRLADELGIDVRAPSHFPINGVHALRGAIAAERENVFEAYNRAAFAAAWQEDRNISSPEVIREIAREIGAPAISDAIADPGIKDALRASTDRVLARGAFGVPTFFVGDEIFWGQDRMLEAARFARTQRERPERAEGPGGDRGRAGGTREPRSSAEAWAFARRWAGAWSRLDVEGVLASFADEVVFRSPLAKQVTGDARVVGKEALRAYWTAALKTTTSMRFDVVDVVWSAEARLIDVIYDRTKDGVRTPCAEQLRFGAGGCIVEGRAFHGA